MAGLSVNVDHIATIRQARGTNTPDPVTAAAIAELAGADGVVVHLREDRRHIQDRDLRILRKTVTTKLILEMAVTEEMVSTALDVKPDMVTLVPEKREELTTEGGLDLRGGRSAIPDAIRALKKAGILVSIFIDPDVEQIKLAHRIDADFIEIHTGRFCDSKTTKEADECFGAILNSIKLASKLKIGVNAGHGLGYKTIAHFRGIPEINEFSIGHSIIARSVFVGLERAVREMVDLVKSL